MYEQKRLLSDPVMVDIEAELSHWQSNPTALGVESGLGHDEVVPTFKFGYDSYLGGHGQPLDELAISLRDRYQRLVPEPNQLPWQNVDSLLRACGWRSTLPTDHLDVLCSERF